MRDFDSGSTSAWLKMLLNRLSNSGGVPAGATTPAQLGTELQINPFLRSRHPDVQQAVAHHAGKSQATHTDDVAVFAALRQWKNDFR